MTLFAHGVEPRGVAKIFSGWGWIWGSALNLILFYYTLGFFNSKKLIWGGFEPVKHS